MTCDVSGIYYGLGEITTTTSYLQNIYDNTIFHRVGNVKNGHRAMVILL